MSSFEFVKAINTKLNNYDYIYPAEGSFAGFTLETRFPKILNDIVRNPKLLEQSKVELISLRDRLDDLRIELLDLPKNESIYWSSFFENHTGKTYREVPFFFLEMYFYRLIIQIISKNQDFIDPFEIIKREDLEKNSSFFNKIVSEYSNLNLNQCLHLSLEGNQADLSQVKDNKGAELVYLINDEAKLINNLPQNGLHIIGDNSGVELFTDLILIKKLAETCEDVTLHLKHLPLLVSDATTDDFEILLDFLDFTGQSDFVSAIRSLLDSKKLKVLSHPFWNAPTFYDQLPFIESPTNLLLSKGDANYRRFFHDKAFSPHLTFDLSSIEFKQVFALRTLKSDIQTSLSQKLIEDLNEKDPTWMHNSKYAVIQKLK